MRNWHTYLEKSLSSNEDSPQPKNDNNKTKQTNKKTHSKKEKEDKSNIFKIENFCVSMDIIK